MSCESQPTNQQPKINEPDSLQSCVDLYGPILGAERYEEKQNERKWETTFGKIIDALKERIAPVKEGKSKFVLIAFESNINYGHGYPIIDPTFDLPSRDLQEVISGIKEQYHEDEITILSKNIGKALRGRGPMFTLWYAYNPLYSNPNKLSVRTAINLDTAKYILGIGKYKS